MHLIHYRHRTYSVVWCGGSRRRTNMTWILHCYNDPPNHHTFSVAADQDHGYHWGNRHSMVAYLYILTCLLNTIHFSNIRHLLRTREDLATACGGRGSMSTRKTPRQHNLVPKLHAQPRGRNFANRACASDRKSEGIRYTEPWVLTCTICWCTRKKCNSCRTSWSHNLIAVFDTPISHNFSKKSNRTFQ